MPKGILALSTHPNLSSLYRGPRILNDASADDKAKADADAKAAADKAAADAKAKADADAKKGDDTEGRISELAKQNKELKAQLKAIDDAKKAEEDEKAKKKGDYERLIQERDATLAAEKKAREEAAAKLEKYEKDAQKRIEEALKGIGDADKQKSAKAMLEGRPLEEQITLLPEVLKLAGATAASGFGAATQQSTSTAAQTDTAQKKKRYEELLAKKSPTPQEIRERHQLMVALQKVWDEDQTKNKPTT